MELDWICSRPAFIDFETRSYTDLTTVHKYASHPTTTVLCCCVKVDGVMHKLRDNFHRLEQLTEGRTLVAHNAPFDCAIWETVLKLPKRKWYDTLPAARAAGFPGKLDSIAKAIGREGKLKYGKDLVDLLCIKPRFAPPPDNPAYGLLTEYCAWDVELLEEVYNRVSPYVNCDFVRDMFTVDRKMNDRGIPVNREHLERLNELFAFNKQLNEVIFHEASGGVNPKSPKQVAEWMQRNGFFPPGGSVGKYAMRELAKDPGKFFCGDGDMDVAYEYLRDMMDVRREVARVGKGKVEAALECLEDDGFIRDMLVVWGAGTGRWSGRGPQFHNMPTNNIEVDTLDLPLTYDAVKEAAERASVISLEKHGMKTGIADILGALLRHMVQGDMCVADYGAVELRGTAYAADAFGMLRILSDPTQSVYIDMGKKLFKRTISKEKDKPEYTLCKTLVLGSTYGMSGKKFGVITQTRTTSGAAMGNLKVDPAEAVNAFRKGYPEIPQLWREMGTALLACAERGEEQKVGRIVHLFRDGPNMHLRLPSGREIVYRNTRIEQKIPGYQLIYNMPLCPIDTVVYDSPRFHSADLFGSKGTENAVQGFCADLIADACVRSEAEGLCPAFTVHDELINMTDDLYSHMRIMSTPPEWAPDFPLLAEGYHGSVWTKQSKRFHQVDALRGRVIRDNRRVLD